MSSIGQALHELPDLFCELFDEIDMVTFREQAPSWLLDDSIRSSAISIERQLIEGSLNAARLRMKLDNHADRERTRFTILSGLDRLFASFNPVNASSAGIPPVVAALAAHTGAEHRLDSDSSPHGGALIPRLVVREDPHNAPDHPPREAFSSVLRVEPDHWDACVFCPLPDEARLLRHEVDRGLRVGCVPFVEDPAEMRIEGYERDGRRLYTIEPLDLAHTLERINVTLDILIAKDLRVALIPELMLSETLLAAWKEAIATRRGATGKLQWLLVGSGNVNPGGGRINEAVLLNARSGDELGRQRKIYPFHFDAETLRLWKLVPRLGDAPIAEDITPGQLLTVLDGGGVRLAILVCEDLARVVDLAAPLRSFGVSHIMVPVFGRPIKDHRWERKRADVYCDAVGSTLMIANSLVMRAISGSDEGSGLVVWPGEAEVLKARDATDVSCFTLAPDGSATLDVS